MAKVKAAYIEPDGYIPEEILKKHGLGDDAKSEKKTVKKAKKPTKKSKLDEVKAAMKEVNK